MRTTAPLLIPIAALALLAVGCTDSRTTAAAPPNGVNNGVEATAPNPNNPYATDPLDPDMNPHYMRNPRGGGRR